MACLTLILTVPFAQNLFHFAPLHGSDLVLSVGAGLVCVTWFELLKLTSWWRRMVR